MKNDPEKSLSAYFKHPRCRLLILRNDKTFSVPFHIVQFMIWHVFALWILVGIDPKVTGDLNF